MFRGSNHRRNEQRKDHRKASGAADLHNQLDWQQRQNAERHRAARKQHAREIAYPRPCYGDVRSNECV